MTTSLGLHKIERIEAFEFQILRKELPLNICIGFEFQILILIKMAYTKSKLPLNFAIRGVPKCVW